MAKKTKIKTANDIIIIPFLDRGEMTKFINKVLEHYSLQDLSQYKTDKISNFKALQLLLIEREANQTLIDIMLQNIIC